jgi:hypothetical protein
MGPIFSWLFGNHALGLGWVLLGAALVGFVLLIAFGKIATAPQIERERARDRETIERQEQAIIRQEKTIARKDELFEKLAAPLERADDLATEAQRMRAANDFIATYLDLFAPKRRGNRIWPHG